MNKNKMKGGILATLAVACVATQAAEGEKPETFLQSDQPFITISDVNREAEAWATCSVAFDMVADLYDMESQPATAKQLRQLGNGAQLAIIMALVTDEITEGMDPDRFGVVWDFAKIASETIPDARRTAIEAEAEQGGAEEGEAGLDAFVTKISNTLQICSANLDSQQMYVDTWRELMKSGLLAFPSQDQQ